MRETTVPFYLTFFFFFPVPVLLNVDAPLLVRLSVRGVFSVQTESELGIYDSNAVVCAGSDSNYFNF